MIGCIWVLAGCRRALPPDRLRKLDHFNGAALVVAAADEPFALKGSDVLVYSGKRGQLERVGDFLEARGVAMLVEEAHEQIKNFFLPLGQCHHVPRTRMASVGELKAKVKDFAPHVFLV